MILSRALEAGKFFPAYVVPYSTGVTAREESSLSVKLLYYRTWSFPGSVQGDSLAVKSTEKLSCKMGKKISAAAPQNVLVGQ